MGTAREVSTHIDAPPARVWAMVADVNRMGEWSPECQRCQLLGGASRADVGTKFRGSNRRKGGWRTESTVTEAKTGEVFAFAVGRKAPDDPDTTWRYTFAPDGEGTLVTERFEITKEPGAVGRWFTKLGTGVTWAERPDDLEAGMRETLERLKDRAESLPQPT